MNDDDDSRSTEMTNHPAVAEFAEERWACCEQKPDDERDAGVGSETPLSNDCHGTRDGADDVHRTYDDSNGVNAAGQAHTNDSGSVTAASSPPTDHLHREASALARQGRLDKAIELYERVLAGRPDYAEAHNNLGIVYGRKGRIEESIDAFHRALAIRPEYAEAHNNLGVALGRRGRPDESVSHLETALQLKPHYPEACNNLGNTFRSVGRTDEALACYRRALALKADYPEAHNNLGNVLAGKELLSDAVDCYEEALRLNPRYAEAHNNLGNALAQLGRHDEAEICYQKALRHNPDYPEAHNNLGNCLADASRLAEAVACYRQALRIKPDYAEAFNNLGVTLVKQYKHSEAYDCYVNALRLKPDYADAHLNRALAWLQTGNFEQGWKEYEWRWRVRETTRPALTVPEWNGEPLRGRSILLYAEQGLGDTLQFIRYAALVKQRGAVVIFESQPQLVPFLSRCSGIDLILPKGRTLPEFQTHCALLSAPRVLGTTPERVPADVPYLYADPALVAQWRRRLSRIHGFRIGVNWQGNPRYKGDRHRSFPLTEFAALAAVPGVRLISLQKHVGSHQLEEIAEKFEVIALKEPFDSAGGAFADTAAVMMNLDLVITSDTSIAHLAGGLGVTTWVPLPWSADWRWMEQRTDSPWYPTMRLFRQTDPGDWSSVFARISEEIRDLSAASQRVAPIAVKTMPGELIDRLCELECQGCDEPQSPDSVRELAELRAICSRLLSRAPAVRGLVNELRSLHAGLAAAARDARELARRQDFGTRFVAASRYLLEQNDHRRALKSQINDATTRR